MEAGISLETTYPKDIVPRLVITAAHVARRRPRIGSTHQPHDVVQPPRGVA